VYRGNVHHSLHKCTVEPGASLALVEVRRQNQKSAPKSGEEFPRLYTYTHIVKCIVAEQLKIGRMKQLSARLYGGRAWLYDSMILMAPALLGLK
jgi:hypothetical protein